MSPQPRLLLLGAVLALGACADPEDRSTDFNYLHATIIEPSCATSGCHSAQTQNGGPLVSRVDLSSPHRACCSLAADGLPNGACDDTPIPANDWVLSAGPAPLMLLLQGIPNSQRDTLDLRCDANGATAPCDYDGVSVGAPCEDVAGICEQFVAVTPEYDQMPIDSPLAPAEIELIAQWIAEGAPCE